jgi:hypothetical protein
MSLNQVSQENTNLPPTGIINGSFKSLTVNGNPVGSGGTLQSAYDDGDGIINMTDPQKPFSLQGTNGGLELTYGSARGTIESINNNIRQQLDIYGTDINHYGTTKVQCDDFSFLSLKPATFGTPLQSLVSDGSGGVAFESTRTYNITWAGNAITGSRWLIPNGNGLTPGGTAGTFATTFYCPHNMTGATLASSREVTGGSVTSVSFYNTTAPGTPIYVYNFPAGAGTEIVVPNLPLVAGETYTAIATDSLGNATVLIDITFTID